MSTRYLLGRYFERASSFATSLTARIALAASLFPFQKTSYRGPRMPSQGPPFCISTILEAHVLNTLRVGKRIAMKIQLDFDDCSSSRPRRPSKPTYPWSSR